MKLQMRYSSVAVTAAVAGLFSLIVLVLLTLDFTTRGDLELLDSPEYVTLKEQLADDPGNPEVIEAARQTDARLRADYFQHRRFMKQGAYLLLGGVLATLFLARWAVTLRAAVPSPRGTDESVDGETRMQGFARPATLGVVALVVLTMSALAMRSDDPLPSVADLTDEEPLPPTPGEDAHSAALAGAANPTTDQPRPFPQQGAPSLPDEAAYARQWPRFRGPFGSGASATEEIPDKWDVASGEGILWKVEVPSPGVNSPIVWDDRVFLTGATLDKLTVLCFEAETGKLNWSTDVEPTDIDPDEWEVDESTGLAAPTAATDGLRVYAIFATGDLVGLDLEGKLLWHEPLGVPDNPYGHASSLATIGDRVIVQFDQGSGKDGKSKLMAIDGVSGKTVWETVQEIPSSWASPLIVKQGDRSLVITCGAPWVAAYDAEGGKEVWRAKLLDGDVGPSPVFYDGTVVVANESGGLFAVKADGTGDVTDTHVTWTTDIDVPDIASPLVCNSVVLTVSHAYLAAFDITKGEDPLWEEDLIDEVSSSPAAVGKRVYLFSEEGKAWIVEPMADECRRIAEMEMGEPIRTCPAFMPGRIYVRGKNHLFCIGNSNRS